MSDEHDRFVHYRGLSISSVTEQQRKEALARALRERRAKHDADEAERQRLCMERHAARMEHFRNQIADDDRFTAEERVSIIEASLKW